MEPLEPPLDPPLGSQALHMYLECSYSKLNHDNIMEALMMALIASVQW